MKIKFFLHCIAAYMIWGFAQEFCYVAFAGLLDMGVWGYLLQVVLSITSILAALYLYVRYVMRTSFSQLYLGRPLPQRKWCVAAICMPVVVCSFYVLFMDGTFVTQKLPVQETVRVFCYALLVQGIRAGVTEEVLFRGIMLGSLQNALDKKKAVLIINFFFILFHLRGTDISDYRNVILMIVSVCICGTALALVTFETGSVWSSAVSVSVQGDNTVRNVCFVLLLRYFPSAYVRYASFKCLAGAQIGLFLTLRPWPS